MPSLDERSGLSQVIKMQYGINPMVHVSSDLEDAVQEWKTRLSVPEARVDAL